MQVRWVQTINWKGGKWLQTVSKHYTRICLKELGKSLYTSVCTACSYSETRTRDLRNEKEDIPQSVQPVHIQKHEPVTSEMRRRINHIYFMNKQNIILNIYICRKIKITNWLRYYATSRKVASGTPVRVIDLFYSIYLILPATLLPWGWLSL
jgi:hypothetical protein